MKIQGTRETDGQALLALEARGRRGAPSRFIEFSLDNAVCGAIASNGIGGVALSSASGDFAEWHAKLNPNEELLEGSVVRPQARAACTMSWWRHEHRWSANVYKTSNGIVVTFAIV